MNVITQYDFLILNFIHNAVSCEALDNFFKLATHLGDGGIMWITAGLILICTKKYRPCGIVMLCALTFGFLTGNLILKPLVARPRPCWMNDAVRLLIDVPRDYSFPSGHTLSSVICCSILGLFERKFLIVALPITVIIAFSRLYLYVHFPSDVIFSVLYGIAVAVTAFKIYERHFKNKNFRKAE